MGLSDHFAVDPLVVPWSPSLSNMVLTVRSSFINSPRSGARILNNHDFPPWRYILLKEPGGEGTVPTMRLHRFLDLLNPTRQIRASRG